MVGAQSVLAPGRDMGKARTTVGWPWGGGDLAGDPTNGFYCPSVVLLPLHPPPLSPPWVSGPV